MQHSSRLVFALLLALLGCCLADHDTSGESYCNDGFCSLADSCDLGICCTMNDTYVGLGQNGTCVDPTTVPTYPAGGECDISNPCMRCPEGQSCQNGNCTANETPECKKDYGCDCDTDIECVSDYCATNGKCRTTQLFENDFCVDDEQCASGICNSTTMRCQGIAPNENCIQIVTNPCTYGYICGTPPTKRGIQSVCIPGAAVGESCQSSDDCYEFGTSCADGECINWYTQGDGEVCQNDNDCAFGLKCEEEECISIEQEQCNAGFCPYGYSCECAGEDTRCNQQKNACESEFSGLFACARASNCSIPEPSSIGFVVYDELCIFECIDEIMAYACCHNCGDEANDVIAFPQYFLQCGNPNTYTYQPSCDGSCDKPVSACPTQPSTGTDDGTDDGTDGNDGADGGSNAASLIPLFSSIAALVFYFF